MHSATSHGNGQGLRTYAGTDWPTQWWLRFSSARQPGHQRHRTQRERGAGTLLNMEMDMDMHTCTLHFAHACAVIRSGTCSAVHVRLGVCVAPHGRPCVVSCSWCRVLRSTHDHTVQPSCNAGISGISSPNRVHFFPSAFAPIHYAFRHIQHISFYSITLHSPPTIQLPFQRIMFSRHSTPYTLHSRRSAFDSQYIH